MILFSCNHFPHLCDLVLTAHSVFRRRVALLWQACFCGAQASKLLFMVTSFFVPKLVEHLTKKTKKAAMMNYWFQLKCITGEKDSGSVSNIRGFWISRHIYYMSRWYCNKSKSQLTSPTPAQAASCCVISGTYSTLVQHLHFFEKKSEKSKRNPKHITKKYKMMELSLKNDMHWHEICIWFFLWFFRFFSKKMQMLNYSKRLSMRREIQNPLMFETDPESFSPAKHFSISFLALSSSAKLYKVISNL
jgi:hypothetical protein